jgi:DNA-binding GntR family transcriptional regulator
MATEFLIKNHKSKTEIVYDTLKKSIIDGKWQPGQRRNADEISKAMNVSRTPVIEASKLLETEGLLKILPQVGLEVPKLTKRGIEETFYIRGVLSGLATAHACKYMEKADIQKLQGLLRSMNQCVSKKNYRKFSKLNREFHYSIFKNCKLPHLFVLLGRYWDNGNRYAKFFEHLPQVMISSMKYHRDILGGLKNRDEERARFAAEKDSVDFGLTVSKYLMEVGASFFDDMLNED